MSTTDTPKAYYHIVPRKEAFLFAAARAIETGNAVNVADNSLEEFKTYAKELGAEPVEAAPDHETMASTRNDDLKRANTALQASLDAANARIVELELSLAAVGDIAVGDWNDEAVGIVDAAVKEPQRYKSRLKQLFSANADLVKMREERDALIQVDLKNAAIIDQLQDDRNVAQGEVIMKGAACATLRERLDAADADLQAANTVIAQQREALLKAYTTLTMVPAKPQPGNWLGIFVDEYVTPAIKSINEALALKP